MNKIENYTDGVYRKKNPRYHVSDSPWKASHIMDMLRKNSITPRSVVEIGCGAGEILVQLREQIGEGVSFVGYDPNPDLHDLWNERAGVFLEFVEGDYLSLETEIVDLGLCIDVFEHVPDYLGFLEAFRTKARMKLFHIPLDLSVQSVLRAKPLAQVRGNAGHLHYFTKETALATLEHAGYKVIDWFYTKTSMDRGDCLRTKVANIPRSLIYPIAPGAAVRWFGGFSLMALAE